MSLHTNLWIYSSTLCYNVYPFDPIRCLCCFLNRINQSVTSYLSLFIHTYIVSVLHLLSTLIRQREIKDTILYLWVVQQDFRHMIMNQIWVRFILVIYKRCVDKFVLRYYWIYILYYIHLYLKIKVHYIIMKHRLAGEALGLSCETSCGSECRVSGGRALNYVCCYKKKMMLYVLIACTNSPSL